MKNLFYISVLVLVFQSCGITKDSLPVNKETVHQEIEDRNGFRELKSFKVTFYYSNSNKYCFTISKEPTKESNSMVLAFQEAERLVKKDSTIVYYTVKPLINQY